MKRFITIAILLLPALFACTNDSNGGGEGATGVVLNKEKLDLMVGETAELTATVLPESLGMGVVWSVIDPKYAEVSDGIVTGKAEGVTYVVATSEDGYKKTACMVSVNPPVKYSVTVKNDHGVPVTDIYGYPGMEERLYVSTSDGEAHEFTWSVADNDAASITSDGKLTLSAVASIDATFVYDVQSSVKVVTEDNIGFNIPIRSSLLKGVKLDNEYNAAGAVISVMESESYPIAALYQGADGPLAIPADGINLELTNTTDFSLEMEDGALSLVVGNTPDASTKLLASMIGSTEKVELAEFQITKDFPVKAKCTNTSSSTLIFTWTEGNGAEADVANAYTATLYKDEACTQMDQSFDFPAGLGAWKNKQPKYIFGGLTPSTKYWFKVVDTTNNLESGVIAATTDPFNIVEMPASITGTGVVLAEDFGEIRWEFDHITTAVGFRPNDNSSFANTEVKTSENNSGNGIYNGYHYSGGGEMTFKAPAEALNNSRLQNWLSDTNVYLHPGYLKLGTSSTKGWILTPEFKIPDGKTATVKVTITAARLNTSQDSNWAVIVLNPTLAKADPDTHTANFDWPDIENTALYQEISFSNTDWGTNSVSGLVLRDGDRIAFGARRNADSNKGRAHISDLTVEVTEIVDE